MVFKLWIFRFIDNYKHKMFLLESIVWNVYCMIDGETAYDQW